MQAVLTIDELPSGALDAAASFHALHVPEAARLLGVAGTTSLVVVMPPASPDHVDWRRAAARDLARAHVPKRVNLVAGRRPGPIAATLEFLGGAPGVTGQYHPLHED